MDLHQVFEEFDEDEGKVRSERSCFRLLSVWTGRSPTVSGVCIWCLDTIQTVERREFARNLRRLGVDIPDDDMVQLMDRLDVNGDKQISFQEFIEFVEPERVSSDVMPGVTNAVVLTAPLPCVRLSASKIPVEAVCAHPKELR